jgi:hypothetical protein
LPTDDGVAPNTVERLDEVLSDGWHEDTPEVGSAISQVLQADSMVAYQERALERMVLRSRVATSTKGLKKGGTKK